LGLNIRLEFTTDNEQFSGIFNINLDGEHFGTNRANLNRIVGVYREV